MNYEHKESLERALISQTWNQSLAGAVVAAIEQRLKNPQVKEAPSALQLAIEKEKEFRSGPNTPDTSEE